MKTGLSALALFISVASYIPYIRDILQHKTVPHAFSWLVWSVLAALGFMLQIKQQAGPGAWVLAVTFVECMVIFLLSLHYGEIKASKADKVSLTASGIALLLYFLTPQTLLSALLITFIDLVGGFVPTFRKTYYHPEGETASVYAIFAVVVLLSFCALNSIQLASVLYPAVLLCANASLAGFIVIRRRQLAITLMIHEYGTHHFARALSSFEIKKPVSMSSVVARLWAD